MVNEQFLISEMADVSPNKEKKQFKKHWPKKKKQHAMFKKMPKDAEEKEELRNDVVEHVNLTRNRTKTLKHFMAQGYPNFLIRKMMGDQFKNPNPEKKPFLVDPEKKSTLKHELAVFMLEHKLDKKDQSVQLKMLVKHFKPKGHSKGQVRSAHHQFLLKTIRRGKPQKLVKTKPVQADVNSPNSDSGVENIEPTSPIAKTISPKRKSMDSISPCVAKVARMTPKQTPGLNSVKKSPALSPSNLTLQKSEVTSTTPCDLSQESITTPKEYPKTPEGYINRKTMRKMKREAHEAAKAGLTPVATSSVKNSRSPDQKPCPTTPTGPTAVDDVQPTPIQISPAKILAPAPVVVASPKLETSEHPLNGKEEEEKNHSPSNEKHKLLTKQPSPIKQSPAKKQTASIKGTPSPAKQNSAKKVLKSSLKKKGKNQVSSVGEETPKEEKRVSFGKNQIKEFNRNQTPKFSRAMKRETDLIKFTPVKNLISFETPAKSKPVVNEPTDGKANDDDCPQLISVIDEPTPELKAVNGTPVEPLVPKRKKKTPPKISPRMTRSAMKKKLAVIGK